MAERGNSAAEPTVRRDIVIADEAREGSAAELARGETVDRYVVLERLGSGGMGVVYSVFDTTLERKVALKLVRGDEIGSTGGRSRLIREAKAMAQLTHPNVVVAYDVGVHNGEVFLAMELVEGVTLRRWLKLADRGWREVLELMLAAGRGLAAAHRLRLVHRDFKPDNVLVGEDGRVRVTDFGLARAKGDSDASGSVREVSGSGGGFSSADVTGEGTAIGTPAYMAPEQHSGLAPDPRADQFSFCVTAFEALYRARPFSGKSLDQVRHKIMAGEIAAPTNRRGVPAAVHRALVRGLAANPNRRHETMDALLAELERALRGRTRVVGIAAAVVGAMAAIALGFGMGRSRGADCSGGSEHIEKVWNESVRADVEASFAATGSPFAGASWARASELVELWVARWQLMHREACEATHVRGEQSGTLLDLRMRCLSDRLADLATIAGLYRSADADVVERAVELAYSLPSVSACEDTRRLSEETPPPAGTEADRAVEEARNHLSRARALRIAGQYDEGITAAGQAVELARGIEYAPLLARGLVQLGVLETSAGRDDSAETALAEAVLAAEAGGSDRVKAQAWTLLGEMVGSRRARFDEGLRDLSVAEATISRIGGDDVLRRDLLAAQGAVLRDKGEAEAASQAYAEALELAESTEIDPIAHARLLNNVGALRGDQGRLDEATDLVEQALAVAEEALGPEHPRLVRYLTNLGAVAVMRDQPERARPYLERALAIADATLPHEHPKRAHLLNSLGSLLADERDWEGALARFAEALEIHETLRGKEHPDTLTSLVNMGTALVVLGRPAEAVAYLQRTLEVVRKNGMEQRSIHVFATRRLGAAYVDLEQPKPALDLVTPLIADLEADEKADPEDLGSARFVKARALWQLGKQASARREAEQARELLLQAEDADDLGDLEKWLEEHG